MNAAWPVSRQKRGTSSPSVPRGLAGPLLHAAGELRRTLVLGAGQADQIDESLRMRLLFRPVPIAPFRGHGIGDVAEHGAPRQQRVALENHRRIEAGAF